MSVSTAMILHNAAAIVIPEVDPVAIHENAMRVREAFPFSVDKRECFGPSGEKTGFFGLFRSDNDVQLSDSSVSEKYTPHNTDDVCALVEAAMCVFGESAVLKTHWQGGHFVTVEPSKADRLAIFGTVDNIFPKLTIFGGYNGKGFLGSLGLWRDMCRNLHIMRQVSGTSVSIRHTKNMYRRMAELQDVFGSLASKWGKVGETALRLEEKTVNLASFLDAMYPAKLEEKSKAGETRHKSRTEDIVRRIVRESYEAGRDVSGFNRPEIVVTGWQALNGLQGYLQHETLAARRQKSELGQVLQTMSGVTATLLGNAERYLIG